MRVLLVHGLAADAQRVGDLLPRPTKRFGLSHLRGFEMLKQATQYRNGRQAVAGFAGSSFLCKDTDVEHCVNLD